MICVMLGEVTPSQVDNLAATLDRRGISFGESTQGEHLVIAIDSGDDDLAQLLMVTPGVQRVIAGPGPIRFVERRFQEENTVVKVGRAVIGDGGFTVIAGPCAVESREQLVTTAHLVKDSGATILRGDAFKPRTSPYAFQGLGTAALEYLAQARAETGLPFVAEIVDPRHVAEISEVADMVRVGTRNMSNYALLKEVGRQPKPVLLKRGRTATIGEWLDAAEYIYDQGNHDIVLVERGIRTFERSTRNTLDISAVPILKDLTHLPVMVDPSHAAGRRDLVSPLAKAALAVGADGVVVDVHPDPDNALVDGDQALFPGQFADLMKQLAKLAGALEIEI